MREPSYSETISSRPGFYVYRLWAGDLPLYVGSVGQRGPRRVTRRLSQHRRTKAWWPQVTRTDVAVCESIGEMVAEETAQISRLRPAHNTQLLNGEPKDGPGGGWPAYLARHPDFVTPEKQREWERSRPWRPSGGARAVIRKRRPGTGQAGLWP